MSTPREPLVRQCPCPICRDSTDLTTVQQHAAINVSLSRLNEPQRRWFVATLSLQANPPTDQELSCMTGLDPKTIRRGRRELHHAAPDQHPARQRHPGGGRQRSEKKTPLWKP
jgi:hypothetical protein